MKALFVNVIILNAFLAAILDLTVDNIFFHYIIMVYILWLSPYL